MFKAKPFTPEDIHRNKKNILDLMEDSRISARIMSTGHDNPAAIKRDDKKEGSSPLLTVLP